MGISLPSDARVEFRLPAVWKEQIEQAAAVQNRSVTEFATSVLTEAAQKILAEHERSAHVQLSNRDRDRFLLMLDGAGTPNKALKAAAKRHRKRIV